MIKLEPKPAASRIAIILGIGLIAVSCAAVLVRLARESSGSNHALIGVFIAFARVAFASSVAVPLGWQAMTREKPVRAAINLGIYAGIALALHFTFWITSLSFTSIAASTTIATTSPIWLSIWAWLVWKQPPTSRVQFGIGLAFLGGVMIAFSDVQSVIAPNPALGSFLALLGALTSTAYFLCSQAAQKQGLSIVAFAGIAYGTAALVLLPLPLLFSVPYFNYPISTYFWLMLLGLIPQLIGHTSINWAVKFVAPTTVATVVLLEPIGSAFLAILIFQEIPGLIIAVGALLIITGVFVAISKKSSRLKKV